MGSDYFLFPRECYASIPDFAIGRAGWDNWFIFKSRWEGWKLVDATRDVTIVHQSHDYRHLPGGQAHYRLPETEENVEQAGGYHTIFTMADAQYNLVKGRVQRRPPDLGALCTRGRDISPNRTAFAFPGKTVLLRSQPAQSLPGLSQLVEKIAAYGAQSPP